MRGRSERLVFGMNFALIDRGLVIPSDLTHKLPGGSRIDCPQSPRQDC
jgi:hypothetical protein